MLKNKEEYLKTVRRPYPPILRSAINNGQCFPEYQKGLVEEVIPLCEIIHLEHVVYYSKAGLNKMVETVYKYWLKPGILNSVRTKLERREKELIESASTNFENFISCWEKYSIALSLIFSCDKPVAQETRKKLEDKISKEKADWFMDKLNIPFEDNFYKKLDYDLATTNDIKKHIKEYEWINSRYGEKQPYTEKEALEKLKKLDKKKFIENWKKEKDELSKIIKEAKNILGPENARIIDLMQFIIYYRTHRTDTLNRATYLAYDIIKDFAVKNGFSYEELIFCTKEEALSADFPTKDVIKERQRDHVFVMENGKNFCFIGGEAESIKNKFKDSYEKVTEFKGDIASKGFAKGKVKIVWSRSDFDMIGEKTILVTSMTTPEMIPIMKKVVAFITDEGGVTSHAAIISRELKKPCIIGTKVATKVLKDGDEVEVNANEGKVTILEKVVNNK